MISMQTMADGAGPEDGRGARSARPNAGPDRGFARLRRRARLLASASFAATLILAMPRAEADPVGGSGGADPYRPSMLRGGAGGTLAAPNAPALSNPTTSAAGGGGGGPGGTGAAGSSATNTGTGGSGGDGGANGSVGAALPTGAAATGGAGGNGGNGTTSTGGYFGGAGGGGAGGFGAIVSGTGDLGTLGVNVAGGNGGNGGAGANGTELQGANYGGYGGIGGGGGGGGTGLNLTGTGVTITIGAGVSATGGNGGNGGAAGIGDSPNSWARPGAAGNAGDGISANNATITVNGSVSGGAGGTVPGGTNGTDGAGIVGSGLTINVGATGVITGGGTQGLALNLSGTNTLSLATGATVTGGVATGDALTFDQAADASLSSVISGAGTVTKQGTGKLTLSGINTYTGATAINAGTLALSGAGSIASSASVTLAGTGAFDISALTGSGTTITSLSSAATGTSVALGAKALTVGDGNDKTFAGVINGTGGSLVKQGSGSLVLTGANTFTGDTVINAGTIEIRGGVALSDTTKVVLANAAGVGLVVTNNFGGALSAANTETIGSLSGGGANGGFVSIASGQSLYIANGGGNTFGGVLSGSGTLQLQAGTLTLTGASTITGSVLPSGGSTLVLSGDGSLAAARVQFGVGSTLDISGVNGSGTSVRTIHANPSNAQIVLGSKTLSFGGNPDPDQQGSNYAFNGTISGSGGITLTSGGYRLLGDNTYTGATTVDGGILWLIPRTNTSIASSSGLVLNGSGGLSLARAGNALVPQIKTLTSSSADTFVDLGALTLNLTAANSSFAGVISGAGGLKLSAGTETLTGVNTYTGATTIDGGTLALSGSGSIAASSGVTLNGTATFDISGRTTSTSVTGLASTSATSTVKLGALALTVNGTGTSTLAARVTGTGGSLVVTGGTLTLQNGVNDFTGGITVGSGGTLRLEADGAAGTGTISTTGSVIDYANGVTIGNAVNVASNTTQFQVVTGTATQAGAIGETGGPRPIEKIGDGALILAGPNTFTGDTTITGGVLEARNGSALSDTAKVTLANAAGVGLTVTDSETIGALAGGGTNRGTVAINTGQTLTLTNGGGNAFAGTITGQGGLALLAGTQTLSGSNDYAGGTSIAAGATLQIGVSGALGTGTVTFTGTATLAGLADAGISNQIDLGDGAAVTIGAAAGTSLTLSPNAFNLNGSTARTLHIGSTAAGLTGRVVLSAAAISAGANQSIAIDAGTLVVGSDQVADNLSGVAAIAVNTGAAFDLRGRQVNVNNLTGAGTVTSRFEGTAVLQLNNTVDTTFSGQIVDGPTRAYVAVTKAGAGTITLSGTNTFSRGLIIGGGTVVASHVTGGVVDGIGSGVLTLSGGTFATAQTSTVNNSVVVDGGGTVAAATGTTLTLAGLLQTENGGQTLHFGSAGATGTVVLGQSSNSVGNGTRFAVDAGTLLISTTTAAAFTQDPNFAGATVAAGATLAVSGGLTIGGASTASGTIRNLGGDNRLSGTMTLSGDASIVSLGGTLTIDTIAGGARNLSIAGPGNTSIGSASTTGVLTVTSGTTTLTGTNAFGGIVNRAGATIVNTGRTTDDLDNAGTYTNSGTQTAVVASNTGTITNTAAGTWTGNVVSNASSITNNGIWNGNVLNNAGQITNTGTWNGTLVNTATGTLINTGTWNGTITSTSLNVTNSGTVNASGSIGGRVDNQNGGALRVSSGGATIGGDLNNTGTATVTAADGNLTVRGTLTNGSTAGTGIQVAADRTLTAGAIQNGAGATTASAGTIIASVANAGGTINLAGTVTGAITNTSGTINVTGTLGHTGALANAGTLNVTAGTFTTSGRVTNGGALSVASGATLVATVGGIANAATGTIVNGGTINDDLDNAGTVTNNATFNAVVATNTGTITNAATGTWTGAVNSNAGTLINQGAWTGNVAANTGRLTNSGTWTGTIANAAGGTLNNAASGRISGSVGNAGTFTNTGLLSGGLANSGTVFANGGSILGAVANTSGSFTLATATTTFDNTVSNAAQFTLAAGGGATGITTFTNTGTTTFAVAGTLGATTFSNTASGLIDAKTAGGAITGSLANAGTVDMRNDAATYTTLTVGGYTGSGAATVRVDIDRSAGATGTRADRLVVAGTGSSGTTVISFADVPGKTPGLIGTPITVVTDAGNATYTASGLTPSGLIQYAFNKVGADWQVSSSLAPSSSGAIAASMAAAVTSIATGFVEPASGFAPVALDPVESQLSLSLWSRAKAGRYDIASETTTGMTSASRFRSAFDGFQVGVDGSVTDIRGSGWTAHLGVTAGDVRVFASDRLSATTSKANVDAPFFGLYGALVGHGYFWDAQILRNYYDIKLSNGQAGMTDQKTAAQGWSFQSTAGKQIPFAGTWFVEPSVSLSYVTVTVGTVTTPGGVTISARDLDSLIGSARLRVGTSFAATETLMVRPSVQASIWREFAGNATALANGACLSNQEITTTRVGTFGQIGVAIGADSRDLGLSGFVRGDLRFGDKINGGSVTAGLRYQF
ncbi:autotransporter-associated beta strand repeat-containing protein [Methyloraptor flagellatus]|uniref:Autotransporter-associated beta strand repeat-containing protein n=1 Tax=Methyloraptor flagellatus TaxID=3162530 RepID=A0AAU7XFC1_9HYPH